MDAIFGRKAFRSDISWVRQAGEKNDAVKAPGRVQNRLLFYGEAYYPARVRRPLTGAQRVAYSIQHPVFGASKSDNLLAPETRTGESGLPWRGFDPGTKGRHWSPPRTGRLGAWIEEQLIPGYTKMGAHARLDALDTAELLHWPEKVGGWPTVIRPISISQGTSLTDLWDDVGVLARGAKERLGYPTQKPLALLDRIIRTSSNEGDLVLDPFCGCATAPIAAEMAGRNWAGIDISAKAGQLVQDRLKIPPPLGIGALFQNRLVTHRIDVPMRTDLGPLPAYNCRQNRETLYGQQGGDCAGCHEHFKSQHLEIDHIISRSKGGTDHLSNLQLLCGNCNRVKGDRGMAYLRTKLQLAS